MNKNELITFIRNPNSLTDADLGELEEIVNNSPYFLNGRFLLAKGSKDLKHPDTKKRVASAAVYSTDRPLFKKYLSDKLFFLSHPPEEEEIEPEIVGEVKASEPIAPIEKNDDVAEKIISKKDQREDTQEEINTQKPKPRREPRFDPTATASFQRRWDTKSEKEQPSPEPKKKNKPISTVTFSGKKIDRSKRSKKRSIRSEITGDSEPSESKKEDSISEEIVQKSPVSKNEKKPEKTQPAPPTGKKHIEFRAKKITSVNKEIQKTTTERDKKTLKSTSIKGKEIAQQRQKVKKSNLQVTSRTTTSPTNKSEVKKTTANKIVDGANRTRNIPLMPSGGIDSILEELKKDMQSLKSSRVKFAEVQQKIEEDDAVSAALKKATSKISIPESKSIPKDEEVANHLENETKVVSEESEARTIKEDREKLESNDKDKKDIVPEKKIEEQEIIVEEVPEGKEENNSKEEDSKEEVPKSEDLDIEKVEPKKAKTNIMPRAKKVTPSKKKATKKEKLTKKVVEKEKATSEKKVKKKPLDKKENKTSPLEDKKDQDNIIDKFIAETPSIKYQKKTEQTENKDLSDQSSEWNKELASEYLAEIYLHQGNKKRAIEIYKSLSLKFPDKKSYFADLISKTK